VSRGKHRQGENNDIDHRANRYARPCDRRDEGHHEAPCRHRRAHVATTKPKPGKKATLAKKARKGRTKAKFAKQARSGSKTARILDLLRRPGGASARELLKTTGWQAHSLRGFLSGTIGKKMGLALTSTKGDAGEQVYSLKA
jgi:hypothetical protein